MIISVLIYSLLVEYSCCYSSFWNFLLNELGFGILFLILINHPPSLVIFKLFILYYAGSIRILYITGSNWYRHHQLECCHWRRISRIYTTVIAKCHHRAFSRSIRYENIQNAIILAQMRKTKVSGGIARGKMASLYPSSRIREPVIRSSKHKCLYS